MVSTTPLLRFPRQRAASHPRCNSPLSRCSSTKTLERSLHRNQQYSITAITDGSGGIVERYAYSAYGTPTITDASGTTRTTTAIGNRYMYTGRDWDEALALYHYRARMYDPMGGRFVSRDPIGFEGSKWGLYEYTSTNPLKRLDPVGTDWLDCVANCLDANDIVSNYVDGGVIIGGWRKVKVESLTEVGTESIWFKQYSRIGTQLGKHCPGMTPKIGRLVVRRGVVIVVIVDGFIDWARVIACVDSCTPQTPYLPPTDRPDPTPWGHGPKF